jgi:hypothetical protein
MSGASTIKNNFKHIAQNQPNTTLTNRIAKPHIKISGANTVKKQP